MRRHAQAGFTLIEVVLAMLLLGAMMLLLYAGLTFALRSWDAGDVNGRRVADRRIGENFVRRELSEVFPLRWKDPTQVKFAFEGKAGSLKFASSRAAGVSQGGLSIVGLDVETGKDNRTRNLVMRRAMAHDDVNDFTPLDAAEKSILLPEVEGVAFAYFGSENDFTDAKWYDEWTFAARMPTMIRIRAQGAGRDVLPEIVMKVMTGEEAGCLENAFQRQCRPRRPNV